MSGDGESISLTPLAPPVLQTKLLKEVEIAVTRNGVRKGVNEVIKSVNRDRAKLVVIAADSDPPELVMVLPGLCETKNVPYVFVRSRETLGRAAGVARPVLAVGLSESVGF